MRNASTRAARTLRRRATPFEHRLWRVLKGRRLGGWKWRRQAPFGRYILDFYCPAARLVIEADGGGHAREDTGDEIRTAWLEGQGLRVIRVWNRDIDSELDAVCQTILAACGGEARREGWEG